MVDRIVYQCRLVYITQRMAVFTDPVVHNNGVIHREADHGKYRSDEVLVDLKRERYNILKEREHDQRNKYVVQQGSESSERVSPVAEAYEDIESNDKQRPEGRPEPGPPRDIARGLRAGCRSSRW